MSKIGHIEIDMKGPAAGVNKGDTIRLDGVDITNCIRSFEIPEVHAGELLAVRLDLMVLPGMRIKTDAHVGVSDRTAQLLEELRWTPPDAAPRAEHAIMITHCVDQHGRAYEDCESCTVARHELQESQDAATAEATP